MIQGEQSVDQRLGVETFCIKLYQIFFGAFNVKLGEEKKFPMCIQLFPPQVGGSGKAKLPSC